MTKNVFSTCGEFPTVWESSITDEKILYYPLARVTGRKVNLISFKLKIENNSLNKEIHDMAAKLHVTRNQLISHIVKQYTAALPA